MMTPETFDEHAPLPVEDITPVRQGVRPARKRVRPSRARPVKREEMRDVMHMDYLSPLEIPAAVKREGYTQAWVRKSVRGEDDFRVEEMVARGWTPIPSSRCPGLSLDPLNRNPLSKNFICYKDVLLMERPQIYSDREWQALDRLNRSKIRSLRGVQEDKPDFHQAPLPDSSGGVGRVRIQG